jgi:queuine tRNA-ribosyltransferase
MLGAQLNTIHNLHYYQDLMAGLRDAIARGELADFVAKFEEEQQILQNEGVTGDG